jgi:hypothetical protein
MRETKRILDNLLTANCTETQVKSELLNWYDLITKQNYFQHKNRIIMQTDGLALGAPSSNTLSETFLQHTEHYHLPHITRKHKLSHYFRYVNDVLLIYDSQHTDIRGVVEK